MRPYFNLMNEEKLKELLSEKKENTKRKAETQWKEVAGSGMKRKGISEVN